jgi:hypothetical protein
MQSIWQFAAELPPPLRHADTWSASISANFHILLLLASGPTAQSGLLKETGKPIKRLLDAPYCLTVLFPSEPGQWVDGNGKTVKMVEGEAYYRQGFQRIRRDAYKAFGALVNAKYLLSYSSTQRTLKVFEWLGFREGAESIVQLE